MSQSKVKVLFSAPHEFLDDFKEKYLREFDLSFREIWFLSELDATYEVEVWIPNPGQHFVIDERVLALFPKLKVISTPSTGTNHIDVQTCRDKGIVVLGLLDNRKALDEISASAEFTFLHVLNCLRRIDVGYREVANGNWRSNEGLLRGREVQGKHVGLVGFGRIGRRLARYFKAFDAKVAFYDPFVSQSSQGARRFDDLGELFAESDIIVICCQLTEQTRGMIDGDLLRQAKDNAVIVNTSRGEVVNEQELCDVLDARPELVFAADVLANEVKNRHYESPLIEMFKKGRVLLTPHIAGATVESQHKAADAAMALAKQVLRRVR